MNNKKPAFYMLCNYYSSVKDSNGEDAICFCDHKMNKEDGEGNCTYDNCPLIGEETKVKPVRNCTKERRFRRFKICVEYLEDFTDYELLQFQQFMGFVYDVKQSYTDQTFEYVVANPFWKSVKFGDKIPEFGIAIKKDEHGNLSFSWSLP